MQKGVGTENWINCCFISALSMSQVWVECGGLDLFSICVLFPYDIIVFPNLYAQYIALCVVSTLYYTILLLYYSECLRRKHL